MPNVLSQAAAGLCTHGGTAQPIAGNPRVKLGGQPVLTIESRFAVDKCPNTVGTSPFPCVFAQFATGAARVRVMGKPVLLDTSAPTNTPTGASTKITRTQTRVKGM